MLPETGMAVRLVPPQPKRSCSWFLCLLAAFCTLGERPAAAGDTLSGPPELRLAIRESALLFGDTSRVPNETLLMAILASSRFTGRPRPRHLRLEVTPFLDELMNLAREAGVPVRKVEDSSAKHLLGISTSFKMHEDLPAVTLYARDSSPELFGAFYPVRRGVTWAVIWPLQRVTIRLQGGDDSEFGNFAIAGVEWRHPARPVAAGIGVPMSLRNARGDVGVIFQFRMKLD